MMSDAPDAKKSGDVKVTVPMLNVVQLQPGAGNDLRPCKESERSTRVEACSGRASNEALCSNVNATLASV